MDSFDMRETARKKADKDIQFSRFICAYFMFDSVNSTLQVAMGINGTALNIIKIGIQMVLMILLVIAINHLGVKKLLLYVYGELIAVAVYGVNFLIASNHSVSNGWFVTIFISCIPLLVSAYLIEDKEILYQMLLKYSWPIFMVSVVNFFFSDTMYDMHFSYSVVLIVLLHLSEWLRKRKKLFLVMAVIEFLMILIHGSRGALLCVVMFIIIKVLCSNKPLWNRIVWSIGLIIIYIVAMLIFRTYSIEIYRLLYALGIKGRTVNLLFSGNFISHDAERRAIWEVTLRLINEKPITGWGIAGAANELMIVAEKGATYPHQMFLDLFLSFGYVLGFLASIFIMINFVVVIRNSGSSQTVGHVFVSFAFMTLMYSSTLFIFIPFYIVLGIGLSLLKQKNQIPLVAE